MVETEFDPDLSPPPGETACTLGMLLLPGFNAMAAHAFVDPFRAANYLRGTAIYRWPFLSLDGGAVTASNGLCVARTTAFAEAEAEMDFLVINASWAPERFRGRALQGWLRRQARMGAVLCALDTGAFVLAYAGLLDGYRAAVHYEHIAAFRELFAETALDESLFVLDHDRLTCCGGMAAADMALEIIRLQQGLDLANGAGRYIFHERLRPGGEGQSPTTREPVGYAAPARLREAIVLMERNLEQPLKITELVARLGLSQRQLERLFRLHTGVSPIRYYVDVRLDRARGLVTQTELPIVAVAAACGFGNAVQFTRTYKRRFGLAPSKDRTEGRVPFQFRSFPSHAGV
ncbi:GlxA family transcriptional regulator [Pelagibius sp.]|uniref:GlxA family transcriptional regulator n=1 Tax=Pelagibius sp. TaxID=1931238 RepID=UPI002612E736|nr:GlxA family transcriptional regulator [Pelagibius sp.]